MEKIRYLLLALCFVIAGAKAQEQAFEGSFEDCKAKAQKENKLILIDMYFVGCMPCAEMDKKVFPDPQVQAEVHKNFILYKTDVMKETDGKKLARKYGAKGFPTYVILNAEGKAILTESGFFGVPRFVPLLQKAVQLNEQKRYLAFDTDLDKEYPAAYSERFIKTGVNHPFSELEPYLAQQKDLFSEAAFLANSVTQFPQYDDWTYDNLTKLIEMYGGNLLMNKINGLAKIKSEQFGSKQDVDALCKMFAYIKPVFNDHLWEVFLPSFVTEFYSASKDAEIYFTLMDEFNLYLKWGERSNALGQVIIDQKENSSVLKKILAQYEEQAKKDKLEFSDQYKLTLLYTYLGDFKNADQAIEQLLTDDFKNPYYKIKKEDVLAIQAAIKRKDINGFVAMDLKRPLGFSMN
ncbi:thioredoxin family protein [Sphingobacterium faecale]|uniref:Thioredoxin family protein n=1 Tax=Sphingobacterium faecale TaxID=2803775 RepID=A0ABS1R4H9_9SPHI|nr:thioredoxin family protein [Sphingobacterium faecale]MBL1409454.1 thioredoxin family protein [Sphingobacterium faecale]